VEIGENVVNWQHLLFTKTGRHSKFGCDLCTIRGEKHPRAFVKFVEGSGIYNFPVHHCVHFYSNFWSFRCSNRGAVTQGRAGWRRAALASPFGPRADRGTAPSKDVACTEATLEDWATTWSFCVRRRPHTRLTPDPFAPPLPSALDEVFNPAPALAAVGAHRGGRRAYKLGRCLLEEGGRHLTARHECQHRWTPTPVCLHSRLVAPRPSLAPPRANTAARVIAPAKSSPEPSSRRTAPGRAAEPHRRPHLHPDQPSKSGLGHP
jgi:hypothetical protein